MYRSNYLSKLAIILAFAFVLMFTIPPLFQALAPKPIVNVDLSIKKDRFRISENGIITASLENKDENEGHAIDLRFVTHSSVHIYLGDEELMKETTDSGNYTYSILLTPSQEVKQPFKIKVFELPVGFAEQKFYIAMELCIDNEMENNRTKEITFTVER